MNSPKGVVESCLSKTSDPFTLVVLAAYRSQELASGIAACIPTDGSKDALVSLKEISSGKLDMHSLENRMIKSLQKFSFLSEEGLSDFEPISKPVPAYESAAMQAHALFQKPAAVAPETDVAVSFDSEDHDEDDSTEDSFESDSFDGESDGSVTDEDFTEDEDNNGSDEDLEEDSDELL
jgi:DNA-directed RNA polymerase subunit K/omega